MKREIINRVEELEARISDTTEYERPITKVIREWVNDPSDNDEPYLTRLREARDKLAKFTEGKPRERYVEYLLHMCAVMLGEVEPPDAAWWHVNHSPTV